MTEYKTDAHAWALETAAALRDGRLDGLDLESIAEEIEDVAGSHQRELESNLIQLLLHLLKRKYQPEKHTRSWDLSIAERADRVATILEKRPSLKPVFADSIADAYRTARFRAAGQTGIELSVFPAECEWQVDELLELCGTI